MESKNIFQSYFVFYCIQKKRLCRQKIIYIYIIFYNFLILAFGRSFRFRYVSYGLDDETFSTDQRKRRYEAYHWSIWINRSTTSELSTLFPLVLHKPCKFFCYSSVCSFYFSLLYSDFIIKVYQ